jgi:hypothetical protein
VVPDTLHDFFVASSGASAALIGLLFVAISIQTEQTFGSKASENRLAFAGSAFTALGNIFFASLLGLLPFVNFGVVVVILGSVGLANSFLLLRDLQRRGVLRLTRGPVTTFYAVIIYGFELWWGIHLWRRPDDLMALYSLIIVIVFAYSFGLARSWELLGGTDYSLIGSLFHARRHGTQVQPNAPETSGPSSSDSSDAT